MHETAEPACYTPALHDTLTDDVVTNARAARLRGRLLAPGRWTLAAGHPRAARGAGDRARGRPDGLGPRPGRPGRDLRGNELRVDGVRLRHLDRRRRHRADLRDVVRRPGRVDPARLRRASGCSSRPLPSPTPSASVRRQPDRPPAGVDLRLPTSTTLAASGRGIDAVGGRDPAHLADERRAGHDHLHVRHDRTPQGLRDHARQPAVPDPTTSAPATNITELRLQRPQHDAALHPRRAHPGPVHPADRRAQPGAPFPQQRRQEGRRAARRLQAVGRPRRALRLRADLQHGQAPAAAEGKGWIFGLAADHRPRLQRVAGPRRARAPPAAASRGVRPARLRQAPRRDRRTGGLHRQRRRAAGRAARPLLPRASGSTCSRATA